jgi:hypothetical protein
MGRPDIRVQPNWRRRRGEAYVPRGRSGRAGFVTRSTALRWVLLALVGLLVAVAVAVLASKLTSQRIGLSSEPLEAGQSLAPAGRGSGDGDGRHPSGGHPESTTTTTTATAPPTTTTTAGPPVTVTTTAGDSGSDAEGGGTSDDD